MLAQLLHGDAGPSSLQGRDDLCIRRRKRHAIIVTSMPLPSLRPRKGSLGGGFSEGVGAAELHSIRRLKGGRILATARRHRRPRRLQLRRRDVSVGHTKAEARDVRTNDGGGISKLTMKDVSEWKAVQVGLCVLLRDGACLVVLLLRYN